MVLSLRDLIRPAMAALLVAAHPALAMDPGPGDPRVLVWHCADIDLDGTGFPGCDAIAEALRVEMGASLAIVDAGATAAVPADPRAAASDAGALFIAWVAPGNQSASYVLYAYDALNDQVLSKSVTLEKSSDRPDAAAVAFLYRNMLGTSLYADLDSIGSDTQLWNLAFPEEKVRVVKEVEGLKPPPEPGPPVVHVGFGYGLLGYPLAPAAWHALCLGLAVRAHELVEVLLDVGASPVSLDRRETGMELSLHLVSVRTGVRVVALDVGPFKLLPGAGLALTVSVVSVTGGHIDGQTNPTFVDGSAYTSLLGRLYLHRHVGIELELGAELLFKPLRYANVVTGEDILEMGRMGLIGRIGFVFAI